MKIRWTHIFAGIAMLIIVFLAYQNYTLSRNRMAEGETNVHALRDRRPHQEDPYRARAVKNTLIKNAESFSACYKTYLTKDPKVALGKTKLDWQISDNGRVKKAGVVSSAFADKDFHTCLTQVVSALEFPVPPVDRYYVEHTFTFEKE